VCSMRSGACSQSLDVEVNYQGECDESSGAGSGDFSGVCDSSTCQFGGSCHTDKHGASSCVCNFNCDALRSPVCGSDGRSYGNECQLKEESCRRQKFITVQPMDNCGDLDEELCDGRAPMVNTLTGKELNCEFGFDSCPAGSYCHKLGSIARCCQEDQPSMTCQDSQHGCCSDGQTAAKGPDHAGCPIDSCQCNSLGSQGVACDPVTRQCQCRPGVDGLRCDRCRTSFWGLQLIPEGNNGCIPCGCNVHGSLRDDCEQMNGRCTCRPGVSGQKCNVCANGKQLGPHGCTGAS